jgi:hypothetical protein
LTVRLLLGAIYAFTVAAAIGLAFTWLALTEGTAHGGVTIDTSSTLLGGLIAAEFQVAGSVRADLFNGRSAGRRFGQTKGPGLQGHYRLLRFQPHVATEFGIAYRHHQFAVDHIDQLGDLGGLEAKATLGQVPTVEEWLKAMISGCSLAITSSEAGPRVEFTQTTASAR